MLGHDRLSVAVFSPPYGLEAGPAGLRWWFLARYLAAAGAEVTVFHHSPSQHWTAPFSVAGGCRPTEIHVPPGPRYVLRTAGRLRRTLHAVSGSHGPSPYALAVADWVDRTGRSGRRMFQAFQQAFASRPLPHLTIGCSVGWEGVRPAFAVHRRYRTPFVVEFQDPWKSYIPSTWRFSEKFVHGTVRHAAATINVTPKWCDDDALDFGKQVLCVLNGFPPEVLGRDPAPGQPGQGQPVRIGYFGTMLCPGFDYEGWLRGLASVAPEQAHFCYAGRNHQDIDRLSQALGTSDRVLAEPPISIWDVFERQRTMDALLLFSFSARNGHFGFKMAETLASGRPVLVVGPDDPWLGDALACGTRVLWARDEREVHQVLRALAAEKARTGIVAGEWKVEAVRPYGWDRIAARLIADIASLLEQPGGTRPPTGPAAPHV